MQTALKRKRSRLACNPCRDRKRKCDGGSPCATCTDWGYECFYETRRTKNRPHDASLAGKSPTPDHEPRTTAVLTPPQTHPAKPGDDGLVRRVEANSGAAFVRKLGLKIDPAKAPKLNLFGWNIGMRPLSSPMTTTFSLPVVEIASFDHIQALANVYFDKVDPCYGFIDRPQFFARLAERWRMAQLPDVYDSVISGVAALGCLFSQRNASITEMHLVRTARSALDANHPSTPPSLDVLTGWALRVIYLRMTDTPHATWIASSTLMHLVEASGLHPSSHSVLPPSALCDPDTQRRLVGVAHHLNIWTSFDLGLSRVSFQENHLPPFPSPKPGDYTAELLGLLPVSISLDPGASKDEVDLPSALSELLKRNHTQPPSVMAQSNLALCILRRIQTQNLSISADMADQVLALLKKALGCAQTLVIDSSPWHQVANVPFQIICVLLTLDTRPSLAMLPEAMQTIKLVATTYNTETTREAYSTANLLLLLHQQRRRDDLNILDQVLSNHQQDGQAEMDEATIPSAEEFSWLGALVADLPGLQRVDLDQFLNTDIMDGPSFFDGPIV